MSIPTCIITGRIAGDSDACGDCDPCIGGAHTIPEPVKRLLAEKDEWREKYAVAAGERDQVLADLDRAYKHGHNDGYAEANKEWQTAPVEMEARA